MSFPNKGRGLPKNPVIDLEQALAAKITKFLRRKYRDTPSAVKRIGRETGISPSTIKKWYEGRTAPRTGHLIMLAAVYPEIQEMLLGLTGYGHLVPFMDRSPRQFRRLEIVRDVPINVPIKSQPEGLNKRQAWFLIELRYNTQAGISDIVRRWLVSEKTAKRDVAGLKARELISRSGSRKVGRYILSA